MEIYVELLDEGVQVWRPVTAQHIAGNVYEILDDGTYGSASEKWMFPPGTWVLCQPRTFSDGEKLVAFTRAQSYSTGDTAEP